MRDGLDLAKAAQDQGLTEADEGEGRHGYYGEAGAAESKAESSPS